MFSKILKAFGISENASKVRKKNELLEQQVARQDWANCISNESYDEKKNDRLCILFTAGFSVQDLAEHFNESVRLIDSRIRRYGYTPEATNANQSNKEPPSNSHEIEKRTKELKAMFKKDIVDQSEYEVLMARLGEK